MSHAIGRVEFGKDMPNRYFVHSSTTGWSFPTLFLSPKEAWQAHELSGQVPPAVPQNAPQIRAIRKVVALGSTFDVDGAGCEEPLFGIATPERLLWPLQGGYEEAQYSLLQLDGINHVAAEVDGAFFGRYDHPLCKEEWQHSEGERSITFEELFGQVLDLCPHCIKKLTKP